MVFGGGDHLPVDDQVDNRVLVNIDVLHLLCALLAGFGISSDDPVTDLDLLDGLRVTAIPSPALAAYQRAEAVIAAAEPTCRLSWYLLAAIGRTSTDHGRTTAFSIVTTRLDDDGVAVPGIVGPAVHEGRQGLVSDTDAGALDHDPLNDRVVGPLHLTPTLWSHVGLDADNDGARNPQDVDDAALAAAVLLCSTELDLSSPKNQAVALGSLNASPELARVVLPLAEAYRADDRARPAGPAVVPVGPPIAAESESPGAAASPEATATVRAWFDDFRDPRWSGAPSPEAPPPGPTRWPSAPPCATGTEPSTSVTPSPGAAVPSACPTAATTGASTPPPAASPTP